jgi:Na+-transporting NADH:ubiquinone oxidoreductase subunit A
MKTVSVKNTYDIQLDGVPSLDVSQLKTYTQVAVLPSSIPYIKPKLSVKEGDEVKVGTPLFYNKEHPEMQFVSPGSGLVSKIHYGPKRIIEKIVVDLDGTDSQISFPKFTVSDINQTTRDDVVKTILSGGLWGLFNEFPFQRIPSPQTVPPIVYVSLDNDEPYHPDSSVYLKDNESFFEAGLLILKKLTDRVVVSKSANNTQLSSSIDSLVTHQIKGHYPANQPGVVLYHTKTSSADNASWGLYGQTVIRLGKLFLTGEYPADKMMVIAGSLADRPRHVYAREGVPVRELLQGYIPSEPTRYIAGGVFTGRQIDGGGFLGFRDNALHLIREGKAPEMLSFFRPGFDKPTFSRTYFSAIIKKAMWTMTTSLNGGGRSCISCGECPKVCPVGLYPQLLVKSIYANDIEESLNLGVLDCVECGLCTYVCPSKIDIDDQISSMKITLEKETRS